MFRILQNCTATIRKSLEGLDYYLAEGGRSFEDLIDIVHKLENDEERAKHLQDVLLAAKRYFKTDFKVNNTSDFLCQTTFFKGGRQTLVFIGHG